MFQTELDEHLGYDKHAKERHNTGNSRNGSYKKKVKLETLGVMVLNIPRDRKGKFEPQLIPKGHRMSDKLEDAILVMYSRAVTTSDLFDQVKDIYGTDVSEGTISNDTNRLDDRIGLWLMRPLDPVYLSFWIEGIVLKIRNNGKYINKCVHIGICLIRDGLKEVLGMWLDENESASFWMRFLTDLKARGVEDILIACTDNLTGFTNAINPS